MVYRSLPASKQNTAQPTRTMPAASAQFRMKTAASRILQMQNIVGNRAVQRMLAAHTASERPIQRMIDKDFKDFLAEKEVEPKAATKELFNEYLKSFGQKISAYIGVVKEQAISGDLEELDRINKKMKSILEKVTPTPEEWELFAKKCTRLLDILNQALNSQEDLVLEQSSDSLLYSYAITSESAMLRANAGVADKERPGWKAEWASAPIEVDINHEAVPLNVKVLVKFISDTNSAVGIVYKDPTNKKLKTGELALRRAARVKPDTRAIGKREFEKQHFGVMRSWHVDTDGNLPNLGIEELGKESLSDRALDYLYHNAWDFNHSYTVTDKGQSPEGIALPAYEKARASVARPGMSTKDDMEAWYNTIADKKEDTTTKKFAQKPWHEQNKDDKIKPQGYAEFNVKFGSNGRLVYDYINNEFYLTGHYQSYECPKDVLKEEESAEGKMCHAFFKLTGVGELQLPEDGTAEVQRLRYWENQRRDGLDTLMK